MTFLDLILASFCNTGKKLLIVHKSDIKYKFLQGCRKIRVESLVFSKVTTYVKITVKKIIISKIYGKVGIIS